MTHRDELLRRVKEVNPLPNDTEIPDGVFDSGPPLAVLIQERPPSRTGHGHGSSTSGLTEGVRRRWVKPAVALAAAAIVVLGVLGALSLIESDQTQFVDRPSTPATIAPPTATTVVDGGEPTTASTQTQAAVSGKLPTSWTTVATGVVTSAPRTVIPPLGEWNPILSTTRANPAPTPATCPPGTNPDTPGPVDQARPATGEGNQAAAFDHRSGRVVYVDENRQTWTLDVCTNTWQQMHPDGTPAPGDPFDSLGLPNGFPLLLVYDIDSDLTINFSGETLAVYDMRTNRWTQRSRPKEFSGEGGAVYDPESGLVIVQSYDDAGSVYSTYDVELDQWTRLGNVSHEFDWLVGYAVETNQLVVQGYGGKSWPPRSGPSGIAINAWNGEATLLPEPGPDIAGGFGSYAYANGTDTAYIHTAAGLLCRFDPSALVWDSCLDRPTPFSWYGAYVGDPLNDRIVLISGMYGDWLAYSQHGVSAVGLSTGDWIELLAPLPLGQ